MNSLSQDWTVPQKWFSHFYAIGSMATIVVFWAELHQPQNVGLASEVRNGRRHWRAVGPFQVPAICAP